MLQNKRVPEEPRRKERRTDAAARLRELAAMQGNLYRTGPNMETLRVGDQGLLHYAMGVAHNEREIAEFAKETFAETPVWYEPRLTGLDERIADIIWDNKITLPIIHIRDNAPN